MAAGGGGRRVPVKVSSRGKTSMALVSLNRGSNVRSRLDGGLGGVGTNDNERESRP